MKKAGLLLLIVMLAGVVKAQSPEDSVKAVINRLFTAMKSSDSSLLKTCFTDSALLQTIVNMNGQVQLKNETVAEFAKAVAGMPKNAADEQIVFDVVKIDGPLAIAWTPYKFYYTGKFSHCGVDSFQLVRINGQWKIVYLVDTRRKTGCGN
ncbi:nuclear transport factor 2 family protein [Foetidibacter luteolus]|uniref:nuclear transport factor 2 family protein n=1 Tax=Foetidibacter luteolus TaxID=2608880 RepID=UPI00129AE698|nr:nuclear transport factor 2 family protein [Foetidibacter luteolus]